VVLIELGVVNPPPFFLLTYSRHLSQVDLECSHCLSCKESQEPQSVAGVGGSFDNCQQEQPLVWIETISIFAEDFVHE
jgi:hypothetical protein